MTTPTLFDVPMIGDDWARVRKTDPVTSHEAADSNNVPASHGAVLWALNMAHGRGLAQYQAENILRDELSPSRVRSAFSELEALGKVKRTEEFRLTPSGRRAQVWAVV